MNADERLDSWKEIAGYLRRGVRTAQRWEREAALPVHRVRNDHGAVYAFRSELDAWWRQRTARTASLDAVAYPSEASAHGTTELRPMPVASFLSHDVRIDTQSAANHAHMAVYFFTLTAMGLVAPSEGMPAARAAAMRALELDPTHASARAMLALVAAHYVRDWASASREFADVLGRHPVQALVRFHYACWYLTPLERDGESLAQLASALADDPVYLIGRVQMGVNLMGEGRFEEGVRELEDVLRIDPRFGPASGHLGRELALRGRTEDAMALAERTYSAIPRHPNAVGFLAGMLARAGERARANALLAALERTSPWAAARARAEAAVIGERWNDAIDALRQTVTSRDPGVWLLMCGGAGRTLRRTRGWDALRAELRLPTG